ncbi:glycosyltransferase [Anaeromyxobacter paludicola]|uniref:Glycosyltransferase 2-like domain-containing protein n=1 Tax=Anaeromyxobacter paludicola TaxID=2918171 RepID=A0ABM7X5I3_9BACT|nr:glycosyltransferase [Anaeromyxobacter paludicola]BDG07074.1 hypothetical protein AMPC_01870 [Anaeromyxobacter paludicola]
MSPATAPRVSLCLIARDEERFLPGCLASARAAVDEVIVVDTGSRDGTVALARAAGARVLEAPWTGDFSAPRNLGLAAATGDWVLQLDADERLAGGAAAALRRAVAEPGGAAAFLVRLHDAARLDAPEAEVLSGAARLRDVALLPRLFRRLPGLAWRGAVHERIDEALAEAGARFALSDVDLVHLGAVPELREALGKRARNTAILRRACDDGSGDVTPFGYLCLELRAEGRGEEAWQVAARGWALVPGQPRTRSLHNFLVARAMLALDRGEPSLALESVAALEARSALGADALLLRGVASLQLALSAPAAGRAAPLAAAVAALRAARARHDLVDPHQVIGGSSGDTAAAQLGLALLLSGRSEEAAGAFEDALRLRPGLPEAALGLAECRLERGDPAGALASLSPLLGARPDGWALAARAAHALGAAADARSLLAEAHRRAGAGFLSPHRLEAARALWAALEGASP